MSGWKSVAHSYELDQSVSDEPALEVLKDVAPELEAATKFVMGEEAGPYSRQLWDSGDMPSFIEGAPNEALRVIGQAGNRVILAIAGMVLQHPETYADERVRQVMDENDILEESVIVNDPDIIVIKPAHILAAAEKATAMRHHSRAVLEPLFSENDVTQESEIMKLLATPLEGPWQKSGSAEDKIYTLQVLYAFGLLDNGGGLSLPSLVERLEKGYYDSPLARAALDKARSSQDDNGELQRLLKLAACVTDMEANDLIVARLSDTKNLPLWDSDSRRELVAERAHYTWQLKKNIRARKDFLTYHNSLIPLTTESAVNNLIENYKLEIAKRARTAAVRPSDRLTAIRLAGDIQRKRRNGSAKPVGNTAIEAVASQIEAPAQNEISREAVYIRPDGELAPEGSPEFRDLFKDYLADRKDQTDLDKDLREIVNYLKTVDLSIGRVRGIKKLGSDFRVTRGGKKFGKMYELKPSEVVGLPTKSERAVKIRVVFTMFNGTVGLLGISDRAKTPALLKSLGLPGRNRVKG